MAAHHRAESSELHPSYIEFLILRVPYTALPALRIVAIGEETTYVCVHLRVGSKGVIEADRHLFAQAFPGRRDVARPCVGTCALLSGEV